MDLEDPTTQAFLLRHIRVAVIVSVVAVPAVGLYHLTTPGGPNRGALGVVLLLATVLTAAMAWAVPWPRVLTSRLGLWAPGLWTASTIVLIEWAAALDGGPESPIAWLVVVPLIAGASSYPPRGVISLGALSIVGHLVSTVAAGHTIGPGVLLQAVSLAVTVAMCAMSSGNHRHIAAQLRQSARDLEELATTDGLTGCANHRAFQEHLQRQISTAHRERREVSLLLLDLDHFKLINDTYGHPTGDEVLCAVASRVRDAVRAGDIVGRIGGEEFAVLLPHTPLDVARQVAERVRASVGAIAEPAALTVSIGVASVPRMAADAEELLLAADQGLYRAKRSGRDRVVVAERGGGAHPGDPSGDVQARVRQVLDEGLLHALFQPVVDLRSGGTVGYEALARVQGSNMPPLEWLDLAARAALHHELEIAMWDAALDAWSSAQVDGDLGLWLNVSPDVLVGGMPWTRRERLPRHVVLELSETAPVRSYPRLRQVVAEWRARGALVAIDDVGAGHANLRHVLELLPDIVKLDRSLVDGIADQPAQQTMIRGIVEFCHDSGSVLVAEGVEDERCARTLRELGVDRAQGWHFGRPSDLGALRTLAVPRLGRVPSNPLVAPAPQARHPA